MKYLVMLGDGMADYPLAELDGKTPLEAAYKPNMDRLASRGTLGMAKTVPQGLKPGSDVANLSVLGYDTMKYYTGRSPLEAVSMGIDLKSDDIAIRCNLVTVSDEPSYEEKTMIDYSSDEISTEEAAELISCLAAHFNDDDYELYPGISYRHCLVRHKSFTGTEMTPPHDITMKPVAGHLPKGRYGDRLLEMMKRSYEILKDHPVNLERIRRGLNPANSCWFWGEGTRPALDPFEKIFGLKGGVVCAVDLIKGLGLCAGMKVPDVPGATGGMVTDFAAKGRAAVELFRDGCELVYIHVEAPDEAGHHGEAVIKKETIETIDREVLGRVLEYLDSTGEPYQVLVTPDHPTPVSIRTHTAEPIPFIMYSSEREGQHPAESYTEANARATGLYLSEGPEIMKLFTGGKF